MLKVEVFSIIFGLSGILFGLFRELISSARLRAQNTISLYEMLHKEDIRVARHSIKAIMAKHRDDDIQFLDMTPEDRSMLSVTCASFDYFGILYKNKKVNRDQLIDTWAPIIIMCYREMQEFISWRRNFWTDTKNLMWHNFDYVYNVSVDHLQA